MRTCANCLAMHRAGSFRLTIWFVGILEHASIEEADFLRDVICDIVALYQDVLDKAIPGRTRASFYGIDVARQYTAKQP
jgi:hypothetical protein